MLPRDIQGKYSAENLPHRRKQKIKQHRYDDPQNHTRDHLAVGVAQHLFELIL